MKVKIGKYVNYFTLDNILKWFTPILGKERIEKIEDSVIYDKIFTFLSPVFQWIYSKRKRTIKVHIDYYDVWSMDHTLSLIIHPMLLKLQEVKQSSPRVDINDLPKGFKGDIHEKWDWVLGEMIYAFEKISNSEWQTEFHRDDGTLDLENYNKVYKRISNGLYLFGKYFQALWD